MPLIKRFGIPISPSMDLDLNAYFAAIERRRTTPNGVFGVKAHVNQCLQSFRNGFVKKHFNNLKFIHILRRNVVAQAVSLSIASQTGKWSSLGNQKKAAEYDFDQIFGCIRTPAGHNAMWDLFFSSNGITPHVAYYEDLLVAPTEVIQAIVDYVGVDANIAADLSNTSLKKQGTDMNKAWEERFKSELLM